MTKSTHGILILRMSLLPHLVRDGVASAAKDAQNGVLALGSKNLSRCQLCSGAHTHTQSRCTRSAKQQQTYLVYKAETDMPQSSFSGVKTANDDNPASGCTPDVLVPAILMHGKCNDGNQVCFVKENHTFTLTARWASNKHLS